MGRIKYQGTIGIEVRRGHPPTGPAPTKDQLVRLYVKESRSVRDVAATLGYSKDAVHRALKDYGVKTRSSVSRSKLRTIPFRDLEAGVREKGMRGTARDLGVDEGTLRHPLKRGKGQ